MKLSRGEPVIISGVVFVVAMHQEHTPTPETPIFGDHTNVKEAVGDNMLRLAISSAYVRPWSRSHSERFTIQHIHRMLL